MSESGESVDLLLNVRLAGCQLVIECQKGTSATTEALLKRYGDLIA